MRDVPPIAHSAAQHGEVLEALAAGDMTMGGGPT